jgi:hypothetical protein
MNKVGHLKSRTPRFPKSRSSLYGKHLLRRASYGDRLAQDLLSDFRFERVFHDQIHFDTQQVGQVIFNRDKCQQAGGLAESDQNIQIAVLLLFVTDIGAKDLQFLHAVTLCEHGNLLVEYLEKLLQGTCACHV